MNTWDYKFNFLDGIIEIQYSLTEDGSQKAFVGYRTKSYNNILFDGEVHWFSSKPKWIIKDLNSQIKGQLLQERGHLVISKVLLNNSI